MLVDLDSKEIRRDVACRHSSPADGLADAAPTLGTPFCPSLASWEATAFRLRSKAHPRRTYIPNRTHWQATPRRLHQPGTRTRQSTADRHPSNARDSSEGGVVRSIPIVTGYTVKPKDGFYGGRDPPTDANAGEWHCAVKQTSSVQRLLVGQHFRSGRLSGAPCHSMLMLWGPSMHRPPSHPGPCSLACQHPLDTVAAWDTR